MKKTSHALLYILIIMLSLITTPFVAAAADHTIIVFDNYLTQDKIDIKVGDTVIWTNSGSVPKIIEADPSRGGCADPQDLRVIIEPGQSYSHTFTVPAPCSYIIRDLSNPMGTTA